MTRIVRGVTLTDDASYRTALVLLYDHPDGRRLIERAFVADPTNTEIELNYLGAADILADMKTLRTVRRM